LKIKKQKKTKELERQLAKIINTKLKKPEFLRIRIA
jgi:hypothetical protein